MTGTNNTKPRRGCVLDTVKAWHRLIALILGKVLQQLTPEIMILTAQVFKPATFKSEVCFQVTGPSGPLQDVTPVTSL
jgi:hypothetical protein